MVRYSPKRGMPCFHKSRPTCCTACFAKGTSPSSTGAARRASPATSRTATFAPQTSAASMRRVWIFRDATSGGPIYAGSTSRSPGLRVPASTALEFRGASSRWNFDRTRSNSRSAMGRGCVTARRTQVWAIGMGRWRSGSRPRVWGGRAAWQARVCGLRSGRWLKGRSAAGFVPAFVVVVEGCR